MSLSEKISKIQALIDRAGSPGERDAALAALKRIQNRVVDEPKEVVIRLKDMWNKRLFMAVCAKYGLKTYRYRGQKHTTAMVRINHTALQECLWPEYLKYQAMLFELQEELLTDLISRLNQGDPPAEEELAGVLGSSDTV